MIVNKYHYKFFYCNLYPIGFWSSFCGFGLREVGREYSRTRTLQLSAFTTEERHDIMGKLKQAWTSESITDAIPLFTKEVPGLKQNRCVLISDGGLQM